MVQMEANNTISNQRNLITAIEYNCSINIPSHERRARNKNFHVSPFDPPQPSTLHPRQITRFPRPQIAYIAPRRREKKKNISRETSKPALAGELDDKAALAYVSALGGLLRAQLPPQGLELLDPVVRGAEKDVESARLAAAAAGDVGAAGPDRGVVPEQIEAAHARLPARQQSLEVQDVQDVVDQVELGILRGTLNWFG